MADRSLYITAQISQLLSNYLGSAYKPEEHWQSSMRSRAGYVSPEPPPGKEEAPFKIKDDRGLLTRLLAQNEYKDAEEWAQAQVYPTYHIDVHLTSRTLKSRFTYSQARFEKVSVNCLPFTCL